MATPSVTEVIGQIWPFDPSFFQGALERDSLAKKKLLSDGIAAQAGRLDSRGVSEMLTNFGTQLHACAQDLMLLGTCNSWRGTYLEGHVRSLKEFFEDWKVSCVVSERKTQGPEYHGTCDGVVMATDPSNPYQTREKLLIDFKTWGAYKHIYGIVDDKGKSQASNVKKVSLQLSMYAELLEPGFGPFDGMIALWVAEDFYKVFRLKRDLSPYIEWKAKKAMEARASESGLILPM